MGVVLCMVSRPVAAEDPRPNIVFFFIDDMGWQGTSVPFHTETTELNRRYRTPNMETLAKDGSQRRSFLGMGGTARSAGSGCRMGLRTATGRPESGGNQFV